MVEWDIDAACMTDKEIKDRLKAMDVMASWLNFKSQYDFHHRYHVSVLEIEQQNRMHAVERGDVYRVVTTDIKAPVRYFKERNLAEDFVAANSKPLEPTTDGAEQDVRKHFGHLNQLWKWTGKHWLRIN
jgi:hypothetical protein